MRAVRAQVSTFSLAVQPKSGLLVAKRKDAGAGWAFVAGETKAGRDREDDKERRAVWIEVSAIVVDGGVKRARQGEARRGAETCDLGM